jgi:hypothetical protein
MRRAGGGGRGGECCINQDIGNSKSITQDTDCPCEILGISGSGAILEQCWIWCSLRTQLIMQPKEISGSGAAL